MGVLRRSAPAGRAGRGLATDRGIDGVQHLGEHPEIWDDYGYLRDPTPGRLGICCSGGGIRSASFCLGGLQVLREERLLHQADYLACVSGGAYISIAHAVMTSETIKQVEDPEHVVFGELSPWAPGSPEEHHLRDRLSYLAPGGSGKLWAGLNLTYGLVKTLSPFLAILYLAGSVVGISLSRLLGEALNFPRRDEPRPPVDPWTHVQLRPFALVAAGLIVVAFAVLVIRRHLLMGADSDGWSFSLQYLAMTAAVLGGVVFMVLVALPFVLHALHTGLLRDLRHAVVTAPIFVAAGGVVGVAARLARTERSAWAKLALRILVLLSMPILIVFPFVGFAYWNAQGGTSLDDPRWRMALAVGSLAFLIWNLFSHDITPVGHLFYRDRLSTAFIGRRSRDEKDRKLMRFTQLPWGEQLKMSTLDRGKTSAARMPELLVCAAVDLSADVPVGRLAAPFTFEHEWSGGPVTGYVPTAWFEEADADTATLPAMMAISGAAVSPSMGKMTRPSLRFAMTMFDVRLGVWLRNPFKATALRRTTADLRHNRNVPPIPDAPKRNPFWKPGSLHLFREALGMNNLDRDFVYVSDGGHWENLGLVELLRRGCTQVVCLDGSGGDAVSLGTLSQAIALARSDLGIEITFEEGALESLRPTGDEKLSPSGFAQGRIVFPDDSEGVLLYVRTVIPEDAPEDIRTFAARDPRFPNHSTADQFFNDAVFESYRALGRHNTEAAIGGLDSAPPAGWVAVEFLE